MWDFGFFLSPRLPAGKIPRVTPIVRNRACWEHEFCNGRKHWQKKKRQERKGPETAPWTVSITRLLWLRQWRTLFLAAIRSLCLLSSRGFSLSLASIRDGERNRTKGTSPIAPQRLPRLPRSPHHPGFLQPPSFLLILLRVPLVNPPVSRRTNLLNRYIQIETSPCSKMPRYLILLSL